MIFSRSLVLVGMDQIARAHDHATYIHLAIEMDQVNEGVGRGDDAGQKLETGTDHVQVAHAAVGHHAFASQRLVNIGVYLVPERAVTSLKSSRSRIRLMRASVRTRHSRNI
jgi:hypothetical protein